MFTRKNLSLLLALCCLSITLLGQGSFPLSTPEEQGIPSESILNLVNAWEKDIHSVHSFMLVRHGKLVARGWWDPYKSEDPHVLFSLSKSFTSAGIGFAVQEKLLSIDDKVISFFPDALPDNPSDHLKAMRVKDLLTMSTGHGHDTFGDLMQAKDNKLVKAFLAVPVDHKPGTLFFYNTGATYILSAIIQKVTGMKLVDYLQPRLFDPLEIKHPKWEESAEGISYGGFGLYLPTYEIAKFGQLYLQKGVWNGKQLLSEEWINQSSSKQVSNGSDPDGFWDQGYGFQFWRNRKHGYRADGAFGQFCLVFPEFDMILAITSGTGDMKGVMDLVWEKLLPTLNKDPLAANPQALAKLKNKLSAQSLPLVTGKSESPIAKKISGKVYQLENNELNLKEISFSFDKKNPSLSLSFLDGKETIHLGATEWKAGEVNVAKNMSTPSNEKMKIATSAAWISNDTFETDICYINSELRVKFLFKFDGDKIVVDGDRNVNFGPTKIPTINGSVKKYGQNLNP